VLCLNRAVSLCVDFIYNGSDACIDCSVVTSGACTYTSNDNCSHYSYDGDSTCVDCTQAVTSVCTNNQVTGCLNYVYDVGTDACFDCTALDFTWTKTSCDACEAANI